jgi:ATP-binding cassette subfamily F protein uup
MSLLLSCQSLSKAHGARSLFNDLSFGVVLGDKIGLIGPNGSGKSTLLKILAGLEAPDRGTLAFKKGLRVGYVPQDSVFPQDPIEKILTDAFPTDITQDPLEKKLHAHILLTKLGFSDLSQNAATLSGGWKKRLEIAKALIAKPDLLLLDEPTNHLDLDGIVWLEKFLQQENLTFMLTSHDRYFLENIATKMMELHSIYPEGIFINKGAYCDFLQKKAEFLNNQEQYRRSLSAKVRAETHWLRQTPKARTTKAQARVQEADRLIKELADIKSRHKQSGVKIDFSSTERETKKLLVAKNISKSLDRLLFKHLSFNLYPGIRLGIVGTNGSGKSTLLRILAGELPPDQGTIKYADGLRIVYFDQRREKLPLELPLRRALAPESDTVNYRGQNIHVNSWGKRFGFTPDRLDLPILYLSGGEKARVLIARLMLMPADLLLLDEPTNDLDIPTLETLEDSLMDFPGAIVLITHDRAMLDRVATSIIGLGVPLESVPILADYSQWEEFLARHQASTPQVAKKAPETPQKPASPSKKLSYREKKELENMEATIIEVEAEIENLQKRVQELTADQQTLLQETCRQLDAAQQQLEQLFLRWQELERKNL